LHSLEKEHIENLNRLRGLNDEMEKARNAEAHSAQDKLRLQEDLENLRRERNELAARMQELTAKYEVYV
jgi:chromosome segregation ATPase